MARRAFGLASGGLASYLSAYPEQRRRAVRYTLNADRDWVVSPPGVADFANTLAKSAYSDSILAMKNKKESCPFFLSP
ncbi:MAG: hypothetical protein ABSB25_05850 [Sedimentisphaerales bacterium]